MHNIHRYHIRVSRSHRIIALHSLCCSILLVACGSTQTPYRAPGGGLPAVYRSPGNVFSVRYADGWGVQESYHLVTDAYEADGVALLAPTDKTSSTLYEGIFHIASMPECPTLKNMKNVTVKNRKFKHATWDGAAAGNRYEGETYTTETDSTCMVITMYAHSCNLSPEECGPTKPQPYDKQALFGNMRLMLETLTIQ